MGTTTSAHMPQPSLGLLVVKPMHACNFPLHTALLNHLPSCA